jgi:glyoxylate reductase
VTRALPGGALDRLRADHDVEVWGSRLPPPARELREHAATCDALLTLLTDDVDAELIAAGENLAAIANYAVGVDNVDVAAATDRGIPVGNTPDVLTETTADLTLALMLAVGRRLVEGHELVRGGDWLTWEPSLLLGRDLHGATVGLVGLGRIGRAVARRLKAFGAEVVHSSRSGGVPLAGLLERSDFVSLHCPLTADTEKLIGEPELRSMKETAYLVNTARGPIVDTQALKRALEQGWIAGAALDVTDPEPLPAQHPLLQAPNLLVLPHVGSATHRTREAMADMGVDNLLAALAGERMPHCVNPEVYERGGGDGGGPRRR